VPSYYKNKNNKYMNKLTEDEIFDTLKDIIIKQLAVKDESIVTKEANFTKDLKADSLDVVELIMVFEEQFDLTIEDEVAGKMVTVQDVVNYILEN